MQMRWAFALITAILLLWAPSAKAFIYWADYGNGSIGRANNDGTEVNDRFITGASGPSAVAVNAEHIYWANQSGNSIGRAKIDGTEVDQHFIETEEPTGVAVSGSYIFWSRRANAIGRANLDGTSPNQKFVPAANPCGVAVDSGHVYWANDGGPEGLIGRSPLGVASAEQEYVTIPGQNFPCGVAVNAGSIFWANTGFFGSGTSIGRANVLTGTGVDESYIGEARAPCGVALDESHLYWANFTGDTIGRSNTDSTGVDQNFVTTGGKEICGVAVDSLTPASHAEPPTSRVEPVLNVGKLKVDRRKGTATVAATVNGAGSVQLSGKGLRATTQSVSAPGTVSLPIKPKGKAKADLIKKGRLKVAATVTFTPNTGGSVSEAISGWLRTHRPRR